MAKIADADYYLPLISPLRFNDEYLNSANRPVLITGVDVLSGAKNDYIVKFRGAPRMSVEASERELLGCFIAMQMEIPVVSPAIMEIDESFADSLIGRDCHSVAHNSLGKNFASKNLREFITLAVDQPLNPHQIDCAKEIIAFDVFISNTDRTYQKPNMLTDGQTIVILDHEIAFSFILQLPFARNPTPWLLRDNEMQLIQHHCLLKKANAKEFDFDGFVNRFDNLNYAFWIKAQSLIPEEWQTGQFETIRDYLLQICQHKNEFSQELKKVFA